jgi:hypothetical protein
MISLKTKEGVEIEVDCVFDPAEVERKLDHCFTPEFRATLKEKAAEAGEIFLEGTFGRRADLPKIQHFLIHLGTVPGTLENPFQGNFIIIIHAHKDALGEAKKVAKSLKAEAKNRNEWDSTTFLAYEEDRASDLPRFSL